MFCQEGRKSKLNCQMWIKVLICIYFLALLQRNTIRSSHGKDCYISCSTVSKQLGTAYQTAASVYLFLCCWTTGDIISISVTKICRTIIINHLNTLLALPLILAQTSSGCLYIQQAASTANRSPAELSHTHLDHKAAAPGL